MSNQYPGGPDAMDHSGYDQIAAHQEHKHAHQWEHDLEGAAVGAGIFFLLRWGNKHHPHITAWLLLLTVAACIAFVIYALNFN